MQNEEEEHRDSIGSLEGVDVVIPREKEEKDGAKRQHSEPLAFPPRPNKERNVIRPSRNLQDSEQEEEEHHSVGSLKCNVAHSPRNLQDNEQATIVCQQDSRNEEEEHHSVGSLKCNVARLPRNLLDDEQEKNVLKQNKRKEEEEEIHHNSISYLEQDDTHSTKNVIEGS
eukprot:4613268-Ditylum_brightwellii.AAC.1